VLLETIRYRNVDYCGGVLPRQVTLSKSLTEPHVEITLGEALVDVSEGEFGLVRRFFKFLAQKKVMIPLLLLCGFIAYSRYRYHQNYPYGWSHCCETQLSFALRDYANRHGGKFPDGGTTPEASLGLLYPHDANAYLLSGKIAAPEETEAVLASGGPLTPQTCGWHYVEGLTTDDDPELALFWCKEPLDHNGGLSDGYVVWTVSGSKEYVALNDWENFLTRQKELRSQGAQ